MKIRHSMNRTRGMTLFEVIVVVFAIVLLAAMLLPALAVAKRKSSHIGCVNCVKQIGLSFKVWGGDNGDKYPMQFAVTNSDTMKLISSGNSYVLWQTMSNELSTPKLLICPQDTEHSAAPNFAIGFSDANISYFLNLDGSDIYPQMILIGDDNLTVGGTPVQPGILNLSSYNSIAWTTKRHGGVGNIGLADGSVQQLTSARFNSALANSISTNQPVIHLVIP